MKHSVTGTNPEISDVSLDVAARGSNLDGCIPHRRFLTNAWITPQIAPLLPAMERFIPEFILARGAM
jgi:hypothetical protein